MAEEIAWRHQGLVLVKYEPEPAPDPEPPAPIRVHDLIACPTCHARVDERCRSATGTPRVPHVNRLAPQLCPCGELLAWKKQLCEECRREARQETYALREQRIPTRLRRRTA